MAVILDKELQGLATRRILRGKSADLFVHVVRGSLRAGVPQVLAVDWVSRERTPKDVCLLRAGDAIVYVDRRTARYVLRCDLTISVACLGPFRWPVLTDPFALDRMRLWEHAHPHVELPSPGNGLRVVQEKPKSATVMAPASPGQGRSR